MNLKIVSCVLVAFLLSLFALISFISIIPDPFLKIQNDFNSQVNEFYPKLNKPDKEILLLLGSSHVGVLNATKINEVISASHDNYLVYDFAYSADTPEFRSDNMEIIILLQPKIIFYGISYRDFISELPSDYKFPKPDDIIKNIFHLDTDILRSNQN